MIPHTIRRSSYPILGPTQVVGLFALTFALTFAEPWLPSFAVLSFPLTFAFAALTSLAFALAFVECL